MSKENKELECEIIFPNGITVKTKETNKPTIEDLKKAGFKYLDSLRKCQNILYENNLPSDVVIELEKAFTKSVGFAYEMGLISYPRKINGQNDDDFTFILPDQL